MRLQAVLALAVLALATFALFLRWRVTTAGLKITSQFRTPWHNYAVGGVDHSTHLFGLAFDVVPDDETTISILRELGFKTLISEGDHVHAEYF